MKLVFNFKHYFYPSDISLNNPKDGWYIHPQTPTWLFRLSTVEVIEGGNATSFIKYTLKKIG